MRMLALCVALLAFFAAPGAARPGVKGPWVVGPGAALLQDPVAGNGLIVNVPRTWIRDAGGGTWSARASASGAPIEIIRPGHVSPDLEGLCQASLSGQFEPDDPSNLALGGHWDLEQLNITLQGVLTDQDGNTWVYTAHIMARNGNFTRFVSALDPA